MRRRGSPWVMTPRPEEGELPDGDGGALAGLMEEDAVDGGGFFAS